MIRRFRPYMLLFALSLAMLMVSSGLPASAQVDKLEEAVEGEAPEAETVEEEQRKKASGSGGNGDLSSEVELEAETPVGPPIQSLAQQEQQEGRELVDLRTRTSRTFALPDGYRESHLFPGSIHYRSEGEWREIDNTLVASETSQWAYENKANRYTGYLPRTLADAPVRFELGDAWVELKLVGAEASPAEVSGAMATYPDVLPGVDARYTAVADALKEDLILASPEATSTFIFDIETSEGLAISEDGAGGINLKDGSGGPTIWIPPAAMYDSSDEERTKIIDLDLRTGEQGLSIALVADPTWLAAPGRVFPVTIDPTQAIKGALKDTWIRDDNVTASYPTGGKIRTGFNDAGDERRALIRFDELQTAIPKKSKVVNAKLSLHVLETTTTNPITIKAHRISKDGWTADASWKFRDPANNAQWTTHGGTHATETNDKFVNKNVGGSTGAREFWFPAPVAQGWVNEQYNNRGFLMKAPTGANNTVMFASTEYTDPLGNTAPPELTITHFPWLGKESPFKYESIRLNDRMSLHVNVANGNLVAEANDLKIKGTGIDAQVDRFYNVTPIDSEGTREEGAFGPGWLMGTGPDVELEEFGWFNSESGGHVGYHGPSGFRVRFDKRVGAAGYDSAPAINSDLTKDTSRDFPFHLKSDKDEGKLKFSATGRLEQQADRNNNQINFSYENGKLTSITDTRNRRITFGYDPLWGYVDEVYDSAGDRRYLYTYDANGRLATYQDPLLNITTYRYDGAGRLAEIEDPRNNKTVITYDTQGRVDLITRITDTANGTGPTTDFDYPAGSTAVSDPSNHSVTHHYDYLGRVTKVVDQLGNETYAGYSQNSNVNEYSDTGASGSYFKFSYNNRNLTGVTLPTGGTMSMGYDDKDHPHSATSVSDFRGNSIEYNHDADGNLEMTKYWCTTASDGTTTCDHKINYVYGSETQQISTTESIQHKGLLKRIDPPPIADATSPGNDTVLEYNNFGELTRIDAPGPNGDRSFTYDAVSRVRTMTNGKGETSTFTYDDLDRLDRVDFADGTYIDYDYDPNGNLILRDDSETAGATQWTYDELNRARTKSPEKGEPTEYDYYANGNMRSVTYSGSFSVSYEYNEANQVKRVIDPGKDATTGTADDLVTTFGYNTGYQRDRTTYPNDVQILTTYDVARRPETIKATHVPSAEVIASLDYTYKNGSGKDTPLVQTETGKAGYKTTYSYDKVSRLQKAETKNTSTGSVTKTYKYDYDKHGNLLSETVDGSTSSFGYDGGTGDGDGHSFNELESGRGKTFDYDGNGNLLKSSDGSWTFSYNAKNQTMGATTPEGSVTGMDYLDGDQTERGSTADETFTWDLLGLGSEQDAQGLTRFVRDDTGALVSMIDPNNERHYYVFDRLGSVINMTDSTGGNEAGYAYTPYGDEKNNTNPALENPWRFAGGYLDPNGLYKFGTRYYSPDLFRWTQIDPVQGELKNPMEAQNHYLYANLNPVNITDPSGRFFEDVLEALFFGKSTYNLFAAAADADGEIDDELAIAVGSEILGAAVGTTCAVGFGLITGGVGLGATALCIGAGEAAGYGLEQVAQ